MKKMKNSDNLRGGIFWLTYANLVTYKLVFYFILYYIIQTRNFRALFCMKVYKKFQLQRWFRPRLPPTTGSVLGPGAESFIPPDSPYRLAPHALAIIRPLRSIHGSAPDYAAA